MSAIDTYKEYVSSVAFNITLTGSQIFQLLLMDHFGGTFANPGMADFRTLNALRGRGLIEWRDTESGHSGPFLTEPGVAVVRLLEMAGHKLPSAFSKHRPDLVAGSGS